MCQYLLHYINHTLYKLVMIHLQTEKGNAFGLFSVFCAAQGDVFCNVQGQCGFAHGRTRRQDNKIRRMQACWAAAEAFQTLAEEIYRLPAPEDDFELKRRLRIITWLQRSKCNFRSKNALLFLRGMLESGQF